MTGRIRRSPPEDYGNITVEVYKQEVEKRVQKKKRGCRQEVTDI